MFPSLFVSGMVGMYTLEARRKMHVVLHYYLLLHNKVDNPTALEELRLCVPPHYTRGADASGGPRRLHRLLEAPGRLHSIRALNAPTARVITLLNDMLAQHPDLDIFDDKIGKIEDRWSHNITYRQLVISSCIGIYQFCWHPYVHDLRRLVPFLMMHNICSLFIAYPIMYLELALSALSKKGVLNCWDLAPLARGVGFAMLGCCMFTALAASAIGARCLALLVHSLHSFLPWLHCAAAADPPCAARHRPLPENALTPAHSFYYNFVLDMKADGLVGGLGNVVWELAAYYIVCWILIYFIVIKRVYSYSKLVLFKDVLAFFTLTCCAIGVTRLDGAGDIFRKCDWGTFFEGITMWRTAVEYSLVEMSVCQGSLGMLGARRPARPALGGAALCALLASKAACACSALLLAGAHAALRTDYDGDVHITAGSTSALVLWADFSARIPGSQFWSALIFFTLFVLSLCTAALLVQTVMSTFTGRSIRKISWAFLILICTLFGLIGIITLCTQGGQYILDFLLNWPVSKPRVPIAAAVAAVITYVYGQTAFCAKVYFAIGEYPNLFMRISWALSPPLLMIMFLLGMGLWPPPDALVGWFLVALTVLPITVVMAFYVVFKCRVRNIVQNEK